MRNRALLLFLPVVVYELCMFVVPTALFVRNSFYAYAGPATIGDTLTGANYVKLATDSFYRGAFGQTFYIVILITLGCIVLGYPVSYVAARSRRWGAILLVGIIGSAFTSAVARTIGWLMLLADSGPIPQLARSIGIPLTDFHLLHTVPAVVIGMVHVELPYMILTCVPLMLSIPVQLEEAAQGLGASWFRTVRQVIIPLSWPGVLGGSLLVMATATGSFTTPAILGGGLIPYAPTIIAQQMGTSLNYPLAAALAVVLGTVVIILSLTATMVTARYGLAGRERGAPLPPAQLGVVSAEAEVAAA